MSYSSSKSVRTLKKVLSVTLAVTTIVWVSGIFAMTPVLAQVTINEGDIIRGPDGIKVYIVNDKAHGSYAGYKRHIFNPAVFNMYGHLSWANIKEVSQATIDSYQTSDLYKAAGKEEIYSLEESGTGAIKHWIKTWADFTGLGYVMDQVFVINDNELNYTGYTTGSDLVYTAPVAEGLAVSLASTSPAASVLITTQSLAHLADFAFSGTATITGITLQRIGVSADTTLSNVYLFDGASRITDAASVASGGIITWTNSAGIFSAAGSKTISVKADMGGTAGETIGVKLTGVTVSTGSVSGLPISGNIHSTAAATLAAVALGTASASGNADPGTGLLVWQSTATISTRDITLSRLALRQIGSINSADIKNFKLYVDGIESGTVAALDGNGYVTFSLSKSLTTGARIIKVTADVIGGSGRNVQLSLRGAYDISVTDSQYLAGITATATGGFPLGAAAWTVNAGTMTVVKSSASPSTNVTVGGSDVSLVKYTFTAYGENIKVETLRVGMITTGGTVTDHTIRNVRIMVGSSQVGSTTSVPAAAAFAAASGTQFTTNFTVVPGTPTTVEIRGDIFDNEGTNDITAGGSVTAIQALLVGGTGTANAVPQVSLGTINVPSAANELGNNLTIASGSISLAQSSTYGAQTIVAPQTAYKLGAFNLSGNSTEAVNINTYEIDFTGGGAFDASDDLTDVYIKYGASTSSIKGTVTDADNTWSLSHTLAMNETITVEVYGTIGSSIGTGTMRVDLTVTGVTANSAVTVYADVTSTNTVKDAGFQGQVITGGTGSFTVSVDASTPAATLVDDYGTITSAAYKFAAVNDAYTITDITITLGNASAVSTVSLYDGTTAITGGSKPGATTVTYSGLSVLVSANSSKVITVQLAMSTVGVGYGTAGSSLLTTLTSATARSSGGVSAAVTESPSNPAGNAMYVYKAIPTITNATLPTSVLSIGTQTIAKLTISSGGTGTISWQKIIFTGTRVIGGTDTLASPTLWDADTNTQISGTAIFTGAFNVDNDTAGGIEFIANAEQQISGSKTYELKVTIAGTLATSDYISMSIAQPSAFAAQTAAFALHSASSVYYYDADAGATVTAGDVRKNAQLDATSAYAQAFTGVATFLASDTTDEVRSFGTVTTGQTIILTETGAATNTIGAITGTLVSTGGFTCTAYDAANGGGSATTTIASILSVKCVNTAANEVVLNTAALGPDAGVQTTTITLTTTTYAADTTAASTDSDLGLALTGGVAPAASVVWSDQSASGHGSTTIDWTNGLLIKVLPSATQTLIK